LVDQEAKQKGFKRWFMERGHEDGRRTDFALHNYHFFYVFVRRSASPGEHSVPGADDGRVGSLGGVITGGGKPKCSKKEFSQ
jgi:hypothetical protein